MALHLGDEDKLDRLRNDAPDLAELVDAGLGHSERANGWALVSRGNGGQRATKQEPRSNVTQVLPNLVTRLDARP
jgi:hypothetical protein